MRYTLTALLILSLQSIAHAQTPVSPDLAIGAGKVLFDKGTLDSELISEIVVTKKDEVKTQLIQNLMNRQLKNSNAAIRQYVASTLELLFSKASSETKKKELLKNTAELALVIGVSEYFLRDLKNRSRKYFRDECRFTEEIPKDQILTKIEFEFMMEYLRNLDLESRSTFANEFLGSFHTEKEYKSFVEKIKAHKIKLAELLQKKCGRGLWLDVSCEEKFNDSTRLEHDQAFYKTLDPIDKIYLSLNYYNVLGFSRYGHDIRGLQQLAETPITASERVAGILPASEVSEVIKNLHSTEDLPEGNFLLKPVLLSRMKNTEAFARESRKGFTSPNHLYIDLIYKVLREHEYVRQFGFFQRTGGKVKLLSNYEKALRNDHSPISQFIQPLEKRIEETVNKLFENYEFVGRLKQLFELSKETLYALHQIGQTTDLISGIEGDSPLKNIIDDLNKELRTLNIASGWDKEPAKNHAKLVSDLSIALGKIGTDSKSISDFLNYIENEVTPQLLTYKMTNQKFANLMTKVDETSNQLKAIGVFKTIESLTGSSDYDSDRIEAAINKYKPYLSLLDNLSNLDKSITYDRIFKFVSDLGSICSSQKAANVLNTMVNFMDKYAIIDNESNKVQIDLEGVTGDFYKRYQENIKSRLMFSFTVGVNTASPWFGNEKIDFATDENGETIANATFISEKIGIKWNAIDFNKGYIKGKSDIKPLINNIHLITYASGLLYQFDALNSVSGFDSSSLGIGVGITFFNNLDFNLSYAGQIGEFKDHNYLNIGFDIQFTEYLGALSKKRKQNQLDEANKN